jgi:hypothetical protein
LLENVARFDRMEKRIENRGRELPAAAEPAVPRFNNRCQSAPWSNGN